jgi:hypothetical protein
MTLAWLSFETATGKSSGDCNPIMRLGDDVAFHVLRMIRRIRQKISRDHLIQSRKALRVSVSIAAHMPDPGPVIPDCSHDGMAAPDGPLSHKTQLQDCHV